MKIEAFILCWNESDILSMVIRHYKKFCDHVIIYDNYSTDSSQLIAESMGCDVKKFGKPGVLDDQAYLDVKNNCWKSSNADWVIVCDCDEILVPEYITLERIFNKLEKHIHGIGNTHIIKPIGWNIYSESMPTNDLLEITTGYFFENYSKCVMFSPKLKEIGFEPGAHKCNPVADFDIIKSVSTQDTSAKLYLLHYKHIGGVERLLKRNKEYMKRMSANNKRKGWGCHYWQPEAQTRREFAERLAISKPLI
jgi:glycosyltransferase involved in cell wall biosynthesis